MRQMRRFAAMMVAGCLALTAAACGADPGTKPSELNESSTSSAATSSPPTSTSAPVDDEKQAVIAAYKGFFETLVTLGPADEAGVRAAIAPYGDGLAVERIIQAMASLRAKNQEPAGKVVFAEITVKVDGNEATATECRNGTTELIVDSATKQQVNQGNPNSLFTTTLIKDQTSAWRVTDYHTATNAC